MYRLLSILRFFLVLGALVLGWLSFSYAATTVVRESNPRMALALVPNDAAAMIKLIDAKAVFGGAPASMTGVKESVRAALRSQAVSASAVRMLALVNYADGETDEANKALSLSEKLSRRDVAAQIGLIQNSVLRNNAARALYHYDTALRTSPGSQASLFPFMVAATAEPELLPDFTKILARGPEWRFPFYASLIEKTPSRENVAVLYRSLLGTKGAFHDEATADLINRLASDKKYPLAYSVYAQVAPDAVKNPLNFNQLSRFQPFDWLLFDDPAAGAFLAPNNEKKQSGLSLFFRAEADVEQRIARKLVILSAGQYQIRAQVQSAQGSEKALVYWSITCDDGSVLASRDRAQGATASFVVPAVSCKAQWIDLNVSAQAQPVSGQIDKVALLSQ